MSVVYGSTQVPNTPPSNPAAAATSNPAAAAPSSPPPAAPSTPAEPPPMKPKTASGLFGPKKVSRNMRLTVIALVAFIIGGSYLFYRLNGGSDNKATEAASQLAECRGDISHSGALVIWYCHEYLPSQTSVIKAIALHKAEIAELKANAAGTPTWVWIVIAMLLANGVGTWFVVLRRRKTP